MYHLILVPVEVVKSATVGDAAEQKDCAAVAVGASGIVLTTGEVVPAELVQPFTVAVTEYSPAMPVVALVLTVGFCSEEVNSSGPVQA